MDKKMKLLLIPVTLVVVALLAAFWVTTYMPLPSSGRFIMQRREYRGLPPAGDIELYYTVRTVISTVNVTLLIFLLITYVDIYRKIKSEFTIGLIMFSMVLLFYALTSNPILHWAFGFYAFGLGPFAMLPDLFACIALAILLYLSVKY
ncbi:MAG: hypothetical protein QXL67_00310 [Candidatus Bathyarchaeia archaeon]